MSEFTWKQSHKNTVNLASDYSSDLSSNTQILFGSTITQKRPTNVGGINSFYGVTQSSNGNLLPSNLNRKVPVQSQMQSRVIASANAASRQDQSRQEVKSFLESQIESNDYFSYKPSPPTYCIDDDDVQEIKFRKVPSYLDSVNQSKMRYQQTVGNKLQPNQLFQQRSGGSGKNYSTILDQYKTNPVPQLQRENQKTEDESVLSKFRKPPVGETERFYLKIASKQLEEFQFKTPPPNGATISTSNFSKPRPTAVQPQQQTSSSKQKKDDEQLAIAMKKKAYEKLNLNQNGKQSARYRRDSSSSSASSGSSEDHYTRTQYDKSKDPRVHNNKERNVKLNIGKPKNAPASIYSLNTAANEIVERRKIEKGLKELQAKIQSKTQGKAKEAELEAFDKQIQARQQKEAEQKQQQELKVKQQKEKNDLLNSLFGAPKEQAQKEDKKSKMRVHEDTNIMQEFQQSMQQKGDQTAVEYDAEMEATNRELAIRAREEYEERLRQEEMRKLRYHNRKSVDELVRPILNLDLIEMFAQEARPEFDQVPIQFESFDQYRNTWIPLFLFETYSQLINKRTENDKDKELLEAQGARMKSKKTYFEGFIQKHNQDMYYIELKLFESAKSEKDKHGNYIMSVLDSLKEFDLLLISQQPLPTNEAKKVTSIDYLMKMRNEKGKMLCMVTNRRKKDAAYVTVKIDMKLHDDYVCMNVRQLDLLKVHVYFFDSMATTFREFRTIKSCEFFPTADIILDPTLINQIADASDCAPQRKQQMETFIHKHMANFNESQLEALGHVMKMKQENFLLIQGPPGTGKTHTIQGIISMLVSANVKRILICGPSNAAIDEIVQRIASVKLFGVLSESQLKEKLLRIGSMDYEPLPTVKAFTLDQKIRDVFDGNEGGDTGLISQTNAIEDKLQNIKIRVQTIFSIRRIIATDAGQTERKRLQELQNSLFSMKGDRILAFQKLDKESKLKQLDQMQKEYEAKREELTKSIPTQNQAVQKPKVQLQLVNLFFYQGKRSEVERRIILQSQIICTTLSMSASDKLDMIQQGEFEYLIVDEACQCVELTNLIPFDHNPKKVILVGDQQQLPATTFSENSDRTFYSRSLFERFLTCDVKRFMLSIQYRMNPLIREFPSNQFYGGMLTDAPNLSSVTDKTKDSKASLMVQELQKTIQNLVFFDLKYAQEQTNDTSKSNKDEAEFIQEIFSSVIKILLSSMKQGSYSEKMDCIEREIRNRIGIITPYKSQVRTLKDCLYPYLKKLNIRLDAIEINTVDAYQGREKDIIIISCVRGSQERTLGFVNDYRRMNVAITRAKHFLWVVGNSRTLKRNENWDQFIEFTKQKSLDLKEPISQGGQSSPKSTRLSCYIQLSTRDQWIDHKLMNILSDYQYVASSPQEPKVAQRELIRNDAPSDEGLLQLQKRSKREDEENQLEHIIRQQPIIQQEEKPIEKKRVQKFNDKFLNGILGQVNDPSLPKPESLKKTPAVPEQRKAPPSIEPKKVEPQVQKPKLDLFDSIMASVDKCLSKK